jgi:Lrp/AsnC family leucine-responsive transcriptional regulator
MAGQDPITDPIDLRILEILQGNARETQAEIARAVGLAPSAVLERIRKLETKGVIRGYTARIDPRALDQATVAFVAVRGDDPPGEDKVARAIADFPEVLEVHHVAGEDCYLVKVRAKDPEHLGQLLRMKFARVPGVRSTRTTIVLETVKETMRLPIARTEETLP